MDAPDHLVGDVGFRPERLQRIALAREDHYWHAPRRRLLLDTIAETMPDPSQPLLDIGCGTGALVDALLAAGFDANGIDPWAGELSLPTPPFRTGTVERLPWPNDSFACVCAFDVLEHVDDVAALAEMRRVTRPDGHLLISVPAYQCLWSERDAAAGHLRRYSRRQLARRLREADFVLERLFGFQFLLLPLLAAHRLFTRRRPEAVGSDREDRPSDRINALLRAFNDAEVTLGRWRRPPIGSSLIAVARPAAAGGLGP